MLRALSCLALLAAGAARLAAAAGATDSAVSRALAVLALLLALHVLADPLQRWRLRHIPGPPALPLLGSVPAMMRAGGPFFFRQCFAKYGPVFKVAMGRKWVVVVADAELMRQAGQRLRSHVIIEPNLNRGHLRRLDAEGLFQAHGEFWRLLRGAWQPAFSSAALSGYLPLMSACGLRLAQQLQAGGGARPAAGYVDVWRALGGMTLQVVGSTAYGRLAVACGDVFRFGSALHGSIYQRIGLLLPELVPALVPLAHSLPDPPFKRLQRARSTLLAACMELIRSWRQQHATTTRTAGGTTATGVAAAAEAPAAMCGAAVPAAAAAVDGAAAPAGPEEADAAARGGGVGGGGGDGSGVGGSGVAAGSFLDLMLAARDKANGAALTDRMVAAQVQTFLLAGYETTANALAFAIYCVATHPEVESRLLAEVDAVLGRDRPPTESDLPRLPYTEAVLNEAMRLFPPAHATTRIVEAGAPLQLGGVSLPPRTPLILAIYSAHHDPAVWPRPEDFIPERFLPASPLHSEVAARVPGAHAPFGYGSRMCIGWKFAMQEAKLVLALLYQRLLFRLQPGQVPLPTATALTLAPRDGLWVRPVLRRAARAE
eukprot:XP_001690270.1 cytochrome P450, CYP711 clan [Chlamydomonas reinhardtii]